MNYDYPPFFEEWDYSFGLDSLSLEDLEFSNDIMRSTWNGFLRGFYRSYQNDMVDERCLGEWIFENITEVEDLLAQAVIFNLSYVEA